MADQRTSRDKRVAAIVVTLAALGLGAFLLIPLPSVVIPLTIINTTDRTVGVTIENQTTGQQWSRDLPAGQDAIVVLYEGDESADFKRMTFAIKVRDGDEILIAEKRSGRSLVDDLDLRVVIDRAPGAPDD